MRTYSVMHVAGLLAVALLVFVLGAGSAHGAPYNYPISTHNLSYVNTLNGGAVPLRDIHGNQMTDVTGAPITVTPRPSLQCPAGCLRFQGYEAISSSSGRTLYYSWEWDSSAGDRPGFVWLADLASRPSVQISHVNGNGADPGGSFPSEYVVTPQAISWNQGYVGASTGGSYQYSPLPVRDSRIRNEPCVAVVELD